MAYKFEWTSKMSVNNEIIDNQHKKLLNQINVLIDSFINKDKKSVVESSLRFLNDYINEHFKYEEEYMSKNNYNKIEEHKKMHGDFIKKYESIKEKIENNIPDEIIILDIENYIGNWWINHIGHADHEYAIYIKNRQVL